PSQDMVLGNYYLTMEREGALGEGSIFKDTDEALIAYQNGYVHLHTRIAVRASGLNNHTFTDEQQDQLLLTTIGKIVFNEILPDSCPYIKEPTKTMLEDRIIKKYFVEKGTNVKEEIGKLEEAKPFKKGFLGDIIAEIFKRFKI